jgi:hypothetical protein
MNVRELEIGVKNLSPSDLETFTKWMVDFVPSRNDAANWMFDMFHAMWDKQIERDLDEGKFDALIEQLKADYAKGLTTPL